MSYFRHSLGADAPAACPPGFVFVEGKCALAPGPGIPPEMVGRSPGGYIFASGSWRRTRAGETGVLPSGVQVNVHGPDVTQVLTEQAGKLAVTDIKLAADLAACVAAGVPPELLATCRQETQKSASWVIWWKECARTGMPLELIPACVAGRQSGQTMQQIVEALQQQAAEGGGPALPPEMLPPPAPPSAFGNRTLLLLGAAVGLGALFFYMRSRG